MDTATETFHFDDTSPLRAAGEVITLSGSLPGEHARRGDAVSIEVTATSNGASRTIRLTRKLAEGGEGSVFATNVPAHVAKIYKRERLTTDRRDKLELMCAAPINCPGVCFPRMMLTNEAGEFVGYIMRQATGYELGKSLFVKKLFLQKLPGWTRRDTITLCITILEKIEYLNSRGIILGDINPQNILVESPTEVYFVDCDSYQLTGFPCPVGTVNFTPPEAQGRDYKTFLRTYEMENFATATLMFMIMLPGKTPYSIVGGESQTENIMRGDFPYPHGNVDGSKMPRGTWGFIWSQMSFRVREAFFQTFKRGEAHFAPADRLYPNEWLDLFEAYLHGLDHMVANDPQAADIFPTHLKMQECKQPGCTNRYVPDPYSYSPFCEAHRNGGVVARKKCKNPKCNRDVLIYAEDRQRGRRDADYCTRCWQKEPCTRCGSTYAKWMLDEHGGMCASCYNATGAAREQRRREQQTWQPPAQTQPVKVTTYNGTTGAAAQPAVKHAVGGSAATSGNGAASTTAATTSHVATPAQAQNKADAQAAADAKAAAAAALAAQRERERKQRELAEKKARKAENRAKARAQKHQKDNALDAETADDSQFTQDNELSAVERAARKAPRMAEPESGRSVADWARDAVDGLADGAARVRDAAADAAEARRVAAAEKQVAAADAAAAARAARNAAPVPPEGALSISNANTAAALAAAAPISPTTLAAVQPSRKRTPVIIAAAAAVVLVAGVGTWALTAGPLHTAAPGTAAPVEGVAAQATLNDYSWAELSQIAQAVSACADRTQAAAITAAYGLTDASGTPTANATKDVMLQDGTNVTFRLVDIYREPLATDGQTPAGLVFLAKDAVATGPMSSMPYFTNGWSDSDLRTWLNGDFLNNQLPADLAEVITPVVKATCEADMFSFDYFWGSGGVNLNGTADSVWLPSHAELAGEFSDSQTDVDSYIASVLNAESTGGQFAALAAAGASNLGDCDALVATATTRDGSAQPIQWWLRSPFPGSDSAFMTVSTTGSPSSYASANDYAGIVPAFCL